MSGHACEFPSWEGPGVGRFMGSFQSQKSGAHRDHERWGETPSSPDLQWIENWGSTESRRTRFMREFSFRGNLSQLLRGYLPQWSKADLPPAWLDLSVCQSMPAS